MKTQFRSARRVTPLPRRALSRALSRTNPRVLPLTLGLAVIALSACRGGDRSWAGTIDTLPSGVVHVRNAAEAGWDSASAWRVEESLRIGEADGGGAAMFGSSVLIAADSQGRIHVLDRQAKEIRTFTSDGAHLRTIGRPGQGPGELTDPNGMAVDPAGRLWVSDPRNSRYSVFDTAGTFVASHRRPLTSFSWIWNGGFTNEGRLFEDFVNSTPDGLVRGLVVYDQAIEPADTVIFPPQIRTTPPFEFTSGTTRMMMSVPFSPANSMHVDPRGFIWSGWSEDFQLIQTTFSGDTVRIVEAQVERIPVTAGERAAAIEPIRKRVGEGVAIDESRIPQVKPAFETLHSDSEGYLWVRRPNREGESGTRYTVLDPEGRLLGNLRLPVDLERYNPPIIQRDAIYGVAPDEFGVLNVVRLRLDRR